MRGIFETYDRQNAAGYSSQKINYNSIQLLIWEKAPANPTSAIAEWILWFSSFPSLLWASLLGIWGVCISQVRHKSLHAEQWLWDITSQSSYGTSGAQRSSQSFYMEAGKGSSQDWMKGCGHIILATSLSPQREVIWERLLQKGWDEIK